MAPAGGAGGGGATGPAVDVGTGGVAEAGGALAARPAEPGGTGGAVPEVDADAVGGNTGATTGRSLAGGAGGGGAGGGDGAGGSGVGTPPGAEVSGLAASAKIRPTVSARAWQERASSVRSPSVSPVRVVRLTCHRWCATWETEARAVTAWRAPLDCPRIRVVAART